MTADTPSSLIARVFRDYLDQPRWVEWRPVRRRSGKVDKVPYLAGTGRKAATDDPETWRAFGQCWSERRGWCFQDGDGPTLPNGVDLDGCRDPEAGVVAPWAMEIVRDFNSYAEISPSGTGVHIFATGAPADLQYKTWSVASAPVAGKEPKVEAFAALGHFLTVTGDRLPEAPEEIRAAPEAWARLLLRKAGERGSDGSKADESRHAALLFLARRLRTEGKSDDDIRAEVNAANRGDNTDLHPEFATKGAADQKQVDRIIKWALNKVEHDDRVAIELRASELDPQVGAAEDALVATGETYKQDTQLVRFVYEEADATKGRKTSVARIRPYNTDWLLCELSALVRCVKFNKKGDEVTTDVPPQLVRSLLAKASDKFPDLVGIIETPTLRPDGSLLATPGYDPATGLMLVNPPPMPPIVERPARDDAEAALALLDDLLVEFPFGDEPSHSVGLSALIAPVVRAAMEHVPLHAVSAPVAGTGKSYLPEVAAYIASGKPAPALPGGASREGGINEEELEKRLSGLVLAGQSLIFINNINGVLGGSFLSQMLTEKVVEVRTLGRTGNTNVKMVATVFANGNNLEISADLVRRTIKCWLDPEMENPETRRFRQPYPHQMVLADRGKYIAAALTLVRAHLVADCPGVADLTPLVGFEDWSRLVRGALVWLGRADPVETQEALRTEDPAVTTLDAVMEAWARAQRERGPGNDKPYILPDAWLTAKELTERNCFFLDNALREAVRARGEEMPGAAKVGMFLKGHKSRYRNGMRIVSEYDRKRHTNRWRLEGWRKFLEAHEADAAEESAKVVDLPVGEQRRSGRKATKRTREE